MFNEATIQDLADLYQRQCGVIDSDEFRNEVLRFVYISRLLRRYANGSQINMRLLINHTIVIHNVFDTVASDLLVQYIDTALHPYLFAVLDMFSRLPVSQDRSVIDQQMATYLQQEIYDNG